MKKTILSSLFLLFTFTIYAQNDCSDALIVCGSNNFSDLNATGSGVQELTNSNTCSSQENNSLWFKVNIKTGGTLAFTLTPTLSDGSTNTDLNIDFDFFVFGPNATCNNIGSAIRCSTTNPIAAGQSNNLTGMNGANPETSEGPGADGNSFVNWITANDNDSYFIVIDRPIGSSNFKLDWTGTATFFDQPNITTPTSGTSYNLKGCDIAGIDTFDLTVNESSILNNQSDVIVSYHTSNNDVLTNTNTINNPTNFQNTSSPQEIFVRLTNTNSECFNTTSFMLIVEEKPDPQQPTPYIICDDTISGSDIDGVSNFLLNTKDSEILGTLNNTEYSVSYHTTLIGAETSNTTDLIDKNNNYVVTGPQTVYIRVEKNGNNCFDASKYLELSVAELPKVNNLITLNQCDSDPDKQTTFNLTLFNENISSNYTNETFEYYTTEADALAGTTQISDPTTYFVDTTGEAWVKTISDLNCYRISKIELFVSYTPNEPYEETFYSCDDFLDINGNDTNANSETDGITFFDFSIAPSLITNDPDIKVEFYESESDRIISINEIQENQNISNYRNYNIPNTTNIPFPIYYKLTSKINNDCVGLGRIFLKVNNLPVFDINTPVILCLNQTPLTIGIESPQETFTYEWRDNNGALLNPISSYEIDIIEGGRYSVTAFTTNEIACPKTKYIEVNDFDIITLTENDIEITDELNSNETNLSINIKGDNNILIDYEFALQDEEGIVIRDFQNETLFKNLEGGIYTLISRHKEGCTPDETLIISVIQFPNFFTPNDDTFNDKWVIKGVNESYYPESSIQIFNRFGVLVAKTSITEEGWDGTYNGKQLPSSDYWYKITLIPPTNSNRHIINKKGHFSLLRK